MVTSTDHEGVQEGDRVAGAGDGGEGPAVVIAPLRVQQKGNAFRLTTDAIAAFGPSLMMLSVQGSDSSIKACRAMLAGNSGAMFELLETPAHKGRNFRRPNGYNTWSTRWFPSKAGYDFSTHRLGYSTWHMLAVSREPGFIPVMSATGLWRALREPVYTTPLLRSWIPWLSEALAQADCLHLLDSFQTNAAVLRCSNQDLDDVVSRGLRERKLLIERNGDA